MSVRLLLLLCCLAIACIGVAIHYWPAASHPVKSLEPPSPPRNPYYDSLAARYFAGIDSLRRYSNTPGAAVAIVHDSTIIALRGFGIKSVEYPDDSVDQHTVFRIASVSKCFAGFLTGILVQDSLLKWDERIITYLPDFRLQSIEATQSLTIAHVLSHTTGLSFHAYTNLIEEGRSLEEMLDKLKDVRLAHPVGSHYSYQNVAFSLIGEVIKASTHKSYEGWMIEKVFGPLKMNDASIDYLSMASSKNAARGHLMRSREMRATPLKPTYYNASPAGGINASISDMANWMIALLGNRPSVIKTSTLDSLFTPRIEAPSKNRFYKRLGENFSSYYGLGWRILAFPEDTLIYHGGYVNGFRSEIAIDRKNKIGICILANAPGDLVDHAIPLFFELYRKNNKEAQHPLLAQANQYENK